jgi:hypothetical protein
VIRKILRRAVVPGFAIMTAAASVLPAAASTAVSPGWRIFQTLHGVTQLAGVAATGPADGWATGVECAIQACPASSVLVLHWDGRSWRGIAPPPAYRDSRHEPSGTVIAAAAGSDAWIFGTTTARGFGLHWTGNAWGAPVTLPPSVLISAAVAPSADDVWAFGKDTSSGAGYAARYDGSGWSTVALPVDTVSASALSASDIWVTGERPGTKAPSRLDILVEHWTGSSWQKVGLSATVHRGEALTPYGIVALSPRDVWVDAQLTTGRGEDVVLFHWNGSSWRQVRFPYQNGVIWWLAQDGHGGIWLVSSMGDTRTTGVAHYSDGTWSKQALPGKVQGYFTNSVAWIPGTTSVWGAGAVFPEGDMRGVLLNVSA